MKEKNIAVRFIKLWLCVRLKRHSDLKDDAAGCLEIKELSRQVLRAAYRRGLISV